MARHAFISYSRVNRSYAQQLAEYLAAAGIPVWFDHRLVAGEHFDEVIRNEIDRAAVVLVVVSPAALESRWVAREIAYADDRGKTVVPLVLEVTDPTFLRLVDVHHEDVSGGRLPDSRLVERLRGLCDPVAGGVADPLRPVEIRQRLRTGGDLFQRRIRGQARANRKILDALARAALGLSGAQSHRDAGRRPRAVMLLAGPTGTGKREAAACIADVFFGRPGAHLRFEMSQFSAEHTVEQLFGAPPGYVGHEQGGVLTNALQDDPNRVIVFDGIEKGHHRFLDRLLLIIEDGRITDGKGVETDFSGSIVVLLTDLGLQGADGLEGAELTAYVQRGVQRHFDEVLHRPELLSRVGDVVVFEHLEADVIRLVFQHQLANVLQAVRDNHSINVVVTEDAAAALWELCTDVPVTDGRNIGRRLETHLINPLARHIVETDCPPGSQLVVEAASVDGLRILSR